MKLFVQDARAHEYATDHPQIRENKKDHKNSNQPTKYNSFLSFSQMETYTHLANPPSQFVVLCITELLLYCACACAVERCSIGLRCSNHRILPTKTTHFHAFSANHFRRYSVLLSHSIRSSAAKLGGARTHGETPLAIPLMIFMTPQAQQSEVKGGCQPDFRPAFP